MKRSVLLLALLSTGCTSLEMLAGPVPTIKHGEDPDRLVHDAVVSLHEYDDGYVSETPFCSGTLIADRWVLTAGHCVDSIGAQDIAVYVGDDPQRLEDGVPHVEDHHYPAVQTVLHPDYVDFYDDDIALVQIDATPTETEVRLPPLHPSLALTDADAGLTLDMVGFGYDENGDFGRKLHLEGPLGGTGCEAEGCPSDVDKATHIYHERGEDEEGICNGDSGGPWLVERDGRTWVAGISSYVQWGCTAYGVGTKVDAYREFLARNVTRPGRVVINEVHPNPEGTDRGHEWIELVNVGGGPVDLDGWTLYDGSDLRHAFTLRTLPAGEGLLLHDAPGAEGPDVVQASTEHLMLGNDHDTVTLLDDVGDVRDEVSWGFSVSGVSFNRAEDGDPEAVMMLHDEIDAADGWPSSPGTRVDGSAF